LDFCEKYCVNKIKKENAVHFIQKLKDKSQTAQQQKQAHHAVSLFYEVVGPISSERVDPLENKDEKIATKKDNIKPTNANWVQVYDGLDAEIKLRHYPPKTLKSYRSWVRHFQNYTRRKDSQLLSTADVKDFLPKVSQFLKYPRFDRPDSSKIFFRNTKNWHGI
jgi:hypothetical protein